jgi:hypothetical protein
MSKDPELDAREHRVRYLAKSVHNWRVKKSRAKLPGVPGVGCYWIVDGKRPGKVIYPTGRQAAHGADLDAIEAFLTASVTPN